MENLTPFKPFGDTDEAVDIEGLNELSSHQRLIVKDAAVNDLIPKKLPIVNYIHDPCTTFELDHQPSNSHNILLLIAYILLSADSDSQCLKIITKGMKSEVSGIREIIPDLLSNGSSIVYELDDIYEFMSDSESTSQTQSQIVESFNPNITGVDMTVEDAEIILSCIEHIRNFRIPLNAEDGEFNLILKRFINVLETFQMCEFIRQTSNEVMSCPNNERVSADIIQKTINEMTTSDLNDFLQPEFGEISSGIVRRRLTCSQKKEEKTCSINFWKPSVDLSKTQLTPKTLLLCLIAFMPTRNILKTAKVLCENETDYLLTFFISCICSAKGDSDARRICTMLFFDCSSPEDAQKQMKLLLNSKKTKSRCGKVWDGNHVAYRCVTCGGSPSSCLCVECFKAGNHEGHDCFIYRSQLGGCCDCGVSEAWAPTGFCKYHSGVDPLIDPSSEFSNTTLQRFNAIFSITLRRMINLCGGLHFCADSLNYVLWFHQLCETHEGIRKIIGVEILKPLLLMPYFSFPFQFPCLDSLGIVSNLSMLEILLKDESLMTQELHTALSNLWLELMFDESFKFHFARKFVKHYAHLVIQQDQALNRITVQVFCIHDVFRLMIHEEKLLIILFQATVSILKLVCYGSPLRIAWQSSLISSRAYLSSLQDIKYVTDNQNLLLNDVFLIDRHRYQFWVLGWLPLLKVMQETSVHTRMVNHHVEVDDVHWHNALVLNCDVIQDFCHILDLTKFLSRSIIAELLVSSVTILLEWVDEALQEEFIKHNFTSFFNKPTENEILQFECVRGNEEVCSDLDSWLPNPADDRRFLVSANQVSMHIPLHRCFSTMIHTLIFRNVNSDDRLVQIFSDASMETIAKRYKWIDHHIRAVVFYHQVVTCLMWRRNGIGLYTEISHFRTSHWHYLYLNADLLSIRLCSLVVPARILLKLMLLRFEVPLDFNFNKDEHSTNKTLSFIVTLLHILSYTSYLTLNEKDWVAHLLRHHLFHNPQSHSYLQESIPKRFAKLIDPILKEIAMYRPAEGMNSGVYHINPTEWVNFELSFPFYSWSEHQQAEEHFLSQLKSDSTLLNNWLFSKIHFPLPSLLKENFYHLPSSCHLHAFIWILFVKILNGVDFGVQFVNHFLCLFLRILSLEFSKLSDHAGLENPIYCNNVIVLTNLDIPSVAKVMHSSFLTTLAQPYQIYHSGLHDLFDDSADKQFNPVVTFLRDVVANTIPYSGLNTWEMSSKQASHLSSLFPFDFYPNVTTFSRELDGMDIVVEKSMSFNEVMMFPMNTVELWKKYIQTHDIDFSEITQEHDGNDAVMNTVSDSTDFQNNQCDSLNNSVDSEILNELQSKNEYILSQKQHQLLLNFIYKFFNCCDINDSNNITATRIGQYESNYWIPGICFSGIQLLYGMRHSSDFSTHWETLDWILKLASKNDEISSQLSTWKHVHQLAKLHQNTSTPRQLIKNSIRANSHSRLSTPENQVVDEEENFCSQEDYTEPDLETGPNISFSKSLIKKRQDIVMSAFRAKLENFRFDQDQLTASDEDDETPKCVICQLGKLNDNTKPDEQPNSLGLIGHIQLSSISPFPRKPACKYLFNPTDDVADTGVGTSVRFSEYANYGGFYVWICGHRMHQQCYTSYRNSMIEQMDGYFVLTCPYCCQNMNVLLPDTKADDLDNNQDIFRNLLVRETGMTTQFLLSWPDCLELLISRCSQICTKESKNLNSVSIKTSISSVAAYIQKEMPFIYETGFAALKLRQQHFPASVVDYTQENSKKREAVHPLSIITKLLSDSIEHDEMMMRRDEKPTLDPLRSNIFQSLLSLYRALQQEMQKNCDPIDNPNPFDMYKVHLESSIVYLLSPQNIDDTKLPSEINSVDKIMMESMMSPSVRFYLLLQILIIYTSNQNCNLESSSNDNAVLGQNLNSDSDFIHGCTAQLYLRLFFLYEIFSILFAIWDDVYNFDDQEGELDELFPDINLYTQQSASSTSNNKEVFTKIFFTIIQFIRSWRLNSLYAGRFREKYSKSALIPLPDSQYISNKEFTSNNTDCSIPPSQPTFTSSSDSIPACQSISSTESNDVSSTHERNNLSRKSLSLDLLNSPERLAIESLISRIPQSILCPSELWYNSHFSLENNPTGAFFWLEDLLNLCQTIPARGLEQTLECQEAELMPSASLHLASQLFQKFPFVFNHDQMDCSNELLDPMNCNSLRHLIHANDLPEHSHDESQSEKHKNQRTELFSLLVDWVQEFSSSKKNTLTSSVFGGLSSFGLNFREKISTILYIGLIPWLRKVHLLLNLLFPSHVLPFNEDDYVTSDCDLTDDAAIRAMTKNSCAMLRKLQLPHSIEELLFPCNESALNVNCDILKTSHFPCRSSVTYHHLRSSTIFSNHENIPAFVEFLCQLQLLRCILSQPMFQMDTYLMPVVVGNFGEKILSQYMSERDELRHKLRQSNSSPSSFNSLSNLFNSVVYFHPALSYFDLKSFNSLMDSSKMIGLTIQCKKGGLMNKTDGVGNVPEAEVKILLYLPTLTNVSTTYQSLYNNYMYRTVSDLKGELHLPNHSALCLLCGSLLCTSSCCALQFSTNRLLFQPSYLIQHAIRCCYGVSAVILQVSESTIRIGCYNSLRESVAIWGSLHLDMYGEEDRVLHHEKPLTLSLNRLNTLIKEWSNHNFKRNSRLVWQILVLDRLNF